MGIAYNPKMVTDGLRFCTDSSNVKSYSGSGSTQSDLITRSSSTDGVYANNPLLSGLSGFTGFCVLDITGTDTGYAYHPISKWNTDTTDASFVLYHFQQFNDNVRTNFLGWYANAGGSWSGLADWYDAGVGRYISTIQYGSSVGGQHWINGTKHFTRSATRGNLGIGTGSIVVDGHITGRVGIHKVLSVSLYNRELSDSEIDINHIVLKRKYGIS